MDQSRIQSVIDVATMAKKSAVLVGCGGGANLARNLVRCGLRRVKIVDRDWVGPENICRQEHMADHVGMRKVDALAAELQRINPAAIVETFACDFCAITDAEIDRHFADADLFVFCVDNLPANARGNEIALRHEKPAVFSGLYVRGRAAEIVFTKPALPSCYRCLCESRYQAWGKGKDLNASSDGTDVLSVQFADGITGMICIGLLTEGADNWYGKLIQALGERQFLQVQIAGWRWNDRDVIREHLQIPEDNDAYFSFCTIARRDSEPGGRCPDCLRHRRRSVKESPGVSNADPRHGHCSP